jgi:hypothetical protein
MIAIARISLIQPVVIFHKSLLKNVNQYSHGIER